MPPKRTVSCSAHAVDLRSERGRLVVVLDNEREVSVPLSRYPTLKRASVAARKAWKIIGLGAAFHWKSLNLDLSLAGLISGLPEVIPAPPQLASRRDRKFSRRAA